jgi:hypothetical protein
MRARDAGSTVVTIRHIVTIVRSVGSHSFQLPFFPPIQRISEMTPRSHQMVPEDYASSRPQRIHIIHIHALG